MNAVDVSGLKVWFDDPSKPVVRDVDFTVGSGCALGLVGESGSGKSTVLRTLAGLIPSWSGSVSIAGTERRPEWKRPLPRAAQMVFQDPYGSLHPRRTVEASLREPLEINRADNIGDRVRLALEEVGLLPEHRFRFPNQLSGGQRQRVAIARALVLAPPLILLDEPTSALDVTAQDGILALLERLRAERDISYLLVSHDLAVVARICENILIMQNGKIVDRVTSDALRRGEVDHPYTSLLLTAHEGYRRHAPPVAEAVRR